MSRLFRFTKKRQIFVRILILAVFYLIFLPLTLLANELLTRMVINSQVYRFMEQYIIPWEVKLVGVILSPFGFSPSIIGNYLAVERFGRTFLIEIAWNCIGWQSLVLFILTAVVVLHGEKYSNISKLKSLVTGILGTLMINLLRIAFISLLAIYFSQRIALAFHDYVSPLLVITWISVFWWFAYAYILEIDREGLRQIE